MGICNFTRIAIIALSLLCNERPASEGRLWRHPRNGDAVCLHFYLLLHGISSVGGDTISLRDKSAHLSSADIEQIGYTHGLKLRVGMLNPAHPDISQEDLPVIARFADSTTASHGLVVLLSTGDDKYTYFNSHTAAINVMSKSDFLRHWDGYVIYVDKTTSRSWWWPGILAALVMPIFCKCLLFLSERFRGAQ